MKKMRSLFLLAIISTASIAPAVYAGQPKMQAALSELRAARASLEQALADKGGHRVKAINLVDQAIVQVEAGIQAGK